MRSLDVNGTKLACAERGAGEPVVLVHGSASDFRTWHSQLAGLSVRYRTIAYSRRYHWPNAPIPEGVDYAMEEHVADLEGLIRSQCDVPPHLVGHSYGAFVCLRLAIRAPTLVQTLTLAEPPVVPLFVSNSPRPSEIVKLVLTHPRAAVAVLEFGSKGATPAAEAAQRGDMASAMRIFGHVVLGERYYRRLSPARLAQVRDNAIRAELVGSGFPPLDDASVRGMDRPTLLVTGRDSPALFHRLVERLQELLPHAMRRDIRAASHMMHEDNAPAFNSVVLSFLSVHDRSHGRRAAA